MQVYHITLTKEKNAMAHKRNSVEVPELEKLLAGKKKKYVRYEEGAVLYSMGKTLSGKSHRMLTPSSG